MRIDAVHALSAAVALACAVTTAAPGSAAADEPPPATDDTLHLFSAGLLFHLTPLQIEGIPGVAPGAAFGLGGGMAIRVGEYVRLGGMGEAGSMTFGDHDSAYRTAFGAFTAGAAFPIGPIEINVGIAIGGQSLTVHHYTEPLADGGYRVERIERSGVMLLPMLGVDIEISRKVRIPIFVHYHHPHWLGGFNDHTVTIHVGPWFNTYVRRPAGGGPSTSAAGAPP